MHAFEAEDVGGDTFEVTLPPNRYSDAASHWGIAREASAILDASIKIPKTTSLLRELDTQPRVRVLDKKLCPRYSAQYFENIEVTSSPKWMQKILIDCGLRPINSVVDVMNYVMLETGEPLHAFDYDKLEGKSIVIRRAKKGEFITSIDGIRYKLDSSMLVIADLERPQAIAGIKGGRGAEVTPKTKRIIVEAANFDPSSIYKTSRALNLFTDASLRFARGLSPHLTTIGLDRASELLGQTSHARAGARFDSLSGPIPHKLLKFDIGEFNNLIGSELDEKTARRYLKKLGFGFRENKVEVPPLRLDIETHEDLAEEIVRLYGLNNLKPSPPHIVLRPTESEEIFAFRDRLRRLLLGFGLNEVYNHSFVSKDDAGLPNFWWAKPVSLENPISSEFEYLRPTLTYGILRNVEDNLRFFNEVRIFEIGKVFGLREGKAGEFGEKTAVSIALAYKNAETFFELKGLIDELLKGLGLTDFFMRDLGKRVGLVDRGLRVESDHSVLGFLGQTGRGMSIAEFDLDKLLTLVRGELEFTPITKFPSIMRDVSILVSVEERIGDIVEAIQNSNPRLIRDVDLIDEYSDDRWENLQSLTFRIVFQRDDRTLTNDEANKEMKKITALLEDKFEAQIR